MVRGIFVCLEAIAETFQEWRADDCHAEMLPAGLAKPPGSA